ncbi:MAG: hypothetical protein GX868_06155 [Actinobacteria bacterium]|nr:hypothetical protein [Actinomycetota bacterium]
MIDRHAPTLMPAANPGVPHTPSDTAARFDAVLTEIGDAPTVHTAKIFELRRGGCAAAIEGAECVLSVRLDGEFISRPVRVGPVAPDGTASLRFAPIPNSDPRWARLVADGD